MKSSEAIEYAKHLEHVPSDRAEPGELAALRELFNAAPEALKRRVLERLLYSAEHFRRGDEPGHHVWYPHWLQAAAWAVEHFGVEP